MKIKSIKYISPIAATGIFAVLASLGFTHSSYADSVKTMQSADFTIMTAARPYHHLQKDSSSIDNQSMSKNLVIRSKRGYSSRPYQHMISKRMVERSEFAALETGKTVDKRFRRIISEGGKPRHLR